MLRRELNREEEGRPLIEGGGGGGGGGVPRTIVGPSPRAGAAAAAAAVSASASSGPASYGSADAGARRGDQGDRRRHQQHHHQHHHHRARDPSDPSLDTESLEETTESFEEEEEDDDDDDDDESDGDGNDNEGGGGESDEEYDDDSETAEDSRLFRRRARREEFLRAALSPLLCLWNTTRDAYDMVTDVDNAWDSPALQSGGVGVGGPGVGGGGVVGTVTLRHKAGVLFWFLVLAVAYAAERSSFKVLVDRAGPFRLFSAEAIAACHAVLLGLWMLVGAAARGGLQIKALGLPLADVGLMAVLDTVHLLLGVISGSHVPPVLSVILVQFTIPLTVFISQCVHPEGKCLGTFCPASRTRTQTGSDQGRDSMPDAESGGGGDPDSPSPPAEEPTVSSWGVVTEQHVCGSFLILVAVVLGICPAVTTIVYPAWFIEEEDMVPTRTAWNTVVFALGCIPAAVSQLYKEHTLAHFKQPVDSNQLNFLLSVFQFAFAMIVSPLVYALQGLGFRDGWVSLYPSTQISSNFYDGLRCFVGVLDDGLAQSSYPEPAYCHRIWLDVVLYVLSIMLVGFAVDKIVHAGATKIMHRAISCGIVLAVISMFFYSIVDDKIDYGPIAHSWHLSCATILVVGSEVFHRVSMEEPTFETTYPEIGNLYEEED